MKKLTALIEIGAGIGGLLGIGALLAGVVLQKSEEYIAPASQDNAYVASSFNECSEEVYSGCQKIFQEEVYAFGNRPLNVLLADELILDRWGYSFCSISDMASHDVCLDICSDLYRERKETSPINVLGIDVNCEDKFSSINYQDDPEFFDNCIKIRSELESRDMDTIAQAIRDAANEEVEVINVATYTIGTSTEVDKAIKYAHAKGVSIVIDGELYSSPVIDCKGVTTFPNAVSLVVLIEKLYPELGLSREEIFTILQEASTEVEKGKSIGKCINAFVAIENAIKEKTKNDQRKTN